MTSKKHAVKSPPKLTQPTKN